MDFWRWGRQGGDDKRAFFQLGVSQHVPKWAPAATGPCPAGVPLLTLETKTGQLRDEGSRAAQTGPEETQEPAGARAGGIVVMKGMALTGQV